MSANEDTGVLTCVIEMLFSPNEVERAVQLLLSAVGRTESKTECRACNVGRDAAEPVRIRYSETWTTEDAFRVHVRSEEFRRVLVAIDMSCEEPSVTVGTLSGRTGISFLLNLDGDSDAGVARDNKGPGT